MLKNYCKVAFRHLSRNRSYALINILGLGLSITCTILIFIFVRFHLSFNVAHAPADRTYRITTELHHDEITYSTGVPSPLIEEFRSNYTFAEKVAGIANISNIIVNTASAPHDKYKENIAFADPAFFDIFNFPLVSGSKQSLLTKRNTAIITARMARKYFGSEEPIGQTIRIDNKLDFIITGLLRDLPDNTDRREEIYLPFDNLKDFAPWLVEEGWWFSVDKQVQCFVLLKPGTLPATVQQSLADISKKHYESPKEWQFQLQPLSDIHFNTNLHGKVSEKNLWALSLIGFFLIITACVNFVNLATAQALGRSKEIGVRKVLGSYRKQLFWQFITETAVIACIAVTLAFMAAYTVLPFVRTSFGVHLGNNLFNDVYLFVFLTTLLIIVTLLSGLYPGLILAAFQPAVALKGKLSQKDTSRFSVRKGLVITQFAISQILIISTLVIANQMRYAAQADMGFTKDAIVMLPLPDNKKSTLSTLTAQLAQISGIENMTFCNAAPAAESAPSTGIVFDTRTESEKFLISLKAADPQYVSTFGLQVLAGRNLHPSDTTREFLLNETTIRNLHIASYDEAIGRRAVINGKTGTIVGVVKNFHNKSLHEDIDPIFITTQRDNYFFCAISVTPKNLNTVLAATQKAWEITFPEHIYTHDFLDEKIARFYEQDNIFLSLIQAFSCISVFIGCLGLYGLVSFMASRKMKEVGIRKVLGATVQTILWMFGKEFIQLTLIAFAIAGPLAWWAMNSWLTNFAYRIEMGFGVFALAILITIIIATLTVGYRALKTALSNPVNSLRDE